MKVAYILCRKAASRAQQHDVVEAPSTARRRKSLDLAPEVAEDLQRTAPSARAAKYQERLATAADALDRGRYDDARRMVQPVLRDLPELAFGHEIAAFAVTLEFGDAAPVRKFLADRLFKAREKRFQARS